MVDKAGGELRCQFGPFLKKIRDHPNNKKKKTPGSNGDRRKLKESHRGPKGKQTLEVINRDREDMGGKGIGRLPNNAPKRTGITKTRDERVSFRGKGILVSQKRKEVPTMV